MKEVSPETALSRVVGEFVRRGWRQQFDVLPDVVRESMQSDGAIDSSALVGRLPAIFFSANNASRTEVRAALENALRDLRIVAGKENIAFESHIYGEHSHVFHGGNNKVTKQITINNQGQFAGNIDSSDSKVRVNNQQQAQISEHEDKLREQMDRPDIQAMLLDPLPIEEKSRAIGTKLAAYSGIALDVATDFAAKFLAEMVRPG